MCSKTLYIDHPEIIISLKGNYTKEMHIGAFTGFSQKDFYIETLLK